MPRRRPSRLVLMSENVPERQKTFHQTVTNADSDGSDKRCEWTGE